MWETRVRSGSGGFFGGANGKSGLTQQCLFPQKGQRQQNSSRAKFQFCSVLSQVWTLRSLEDSFLNIERGGGGIQQ